MGTTLHLCVGSACHQRGVYHVLPVLQRLLAEHGLVEQVEVKGAFCLGPCMNAMVIQVGERQFLNITPHNIEQRFYEEILPYLRQ